MPRRPSFSFRTRGKALLCALCLTLCAALRAEERTERIDASLIRLHILAVSDSDAEQAIKLRVRDAVLACLAPKLAEADSKEMAREILGNSLDEIERAASSAAEGRRVAVALGREYYPTRRYGSFALPAGSYDSLRVTLGEGGGHNWWCVVFPPVCLCPESTEELEETVGEETFEILTSDGTALRFRLLELWGRLRSGLLAPDENGRNLTEGFNSA